LSSAHRIQFLSLVALFLAHIFFHFTAMQAIRAQPCHGHTGMLHEYTFPHNGLDHFDHWLDIEKRTIPGGPIKTSCSATDHQAAGRDGVDKKPGPFRLPAG